MAQPRDYTRNYNFNDFQTTNPSDPLPASQVDNEFNDVKLTLDDLNANIALIQRDDGKIANASVHKEALSQDALALVTAGSLTPRGDWAATTVYAAADIVNFNDATYLATVAHTAVSAFATDLASGNWILIANAAIAGTASAVDKFEGDGSQTVFTLTYSYTGNTDVQVYVNGALRNPGDDYSISTNTLTFVTAPSVPAVPGNENVIIWGTSVVVEAAKSAAQSASSNASGFATTAQQQAVIATTKAGEAAADVVLTNADVVLTNADVVLTHADVVLTNADVVTTNADAATTTADRAQVNTDKGIVAADKAIVAADKALVAADKLAADASATAAQASEDEAEKWAQETGGEAVTGQGYSAKAWSIGGTGVTDTAGAGPAKDWATETTGSVDGTEYSAKEYSIGTGDNSGMNTGSAKQWSLGGGTGFDRDTAVTGSGLTAEYSAKYWANQAANSAKDFVDVYYGSFTSDSAAENYQLNTNQGSVNVGDLYFNSSDNVMRVRSFSGWNDVAADTTSFATNGFSIAMSIAL